MRLTGTYSSICRCCNANCPITVSMEDGRPVHVEGNKQSPLYEGYFCTRGQSIIDQMESEHRLLRPLRRQGDGTFGEVSAADALDDISEKLKKIIAEHGPSSVALYYGTCAGLNPAGPALAQAFMTEIGSPMIFHSGTIDQPGKHFAQAFMGGWDAGVQSFYDADVWMMVGANPLVSMSGVMPAQNPGRHLKDALKRGMKLIVIDPRRSETARRAHIHLQARPGEDAVLLAAMLRVVIEERLYDDAFVEANVSGLEALAGSLAPYTPEMAAMRADVAAEDIVAAARTFASAKRGIVAASTGANMSGRSTLTEYLGLALNTICGRFIREGEAVPNPGVFLARATPRAQPHPPYSPVFPEVKLGTRGFAMTVLGMPCTALAEEILDGRIKALFSVGGNPAAAFPQQDLTIRGLQALDLFVQLDIRMSTSAKLATHVVPPPILLEVPTTTIGNESLELLFANWGYSKPFGMYAAQLMEPPQESDLVEEWRVFHELGNRLGLELKIAFHPPVNSTKREAREPLPLDMDSKQSTDDLLGFMAQGSRVPLAQVKDHPHGALFPEEIRALPKSPDCTARMDVAHPRMIGELAEVIDEEDVRPEYPYRLVSRRMAHVYNSCGRDLPQLIRKGGTYNPAFMNSADLADLGLEDGSPVEIGSPHGKIQAFVGVDDALRPGLISMSHAFGDLPGTGSPAQVGSNTSQLTAVDDNYDEQSGIPIMSAVRVWCRPIRGWSLQA